MSIISQYAQAHQRLRIENSAQALSCVINFVHGQVSGFYDKLVVAPNVNRKWHHPWAG
jgi:hypothetical protein